MVRNGAVIDKHSVRVRMTQAIDELLDATGTSQAQLGRELGIDPGSICRKLRELRDWRATEIAHMAVLFHVSPDFFFGEDVEVAWLAKLRAARAQSQRRETRSLSSLRMEESIATGG